MLGEPFERMGALNPASSLETSLRITEVRVLVSGLGYDTVRFVVTGAEREDGSARPENLEVRVLDSDGDVLQLEDAVVMGVAHYELDEYPGQRLWRECVSLRIPSEVESLRIEASLLDGTGATSSSFDLGALTSLRDEWLARVRAAEYEPAYDGWFRDKRVTMRDCAAQRIAQEHFALRPLISIIVPLYYTPLDFFKEMADSVLAQTYPNFELVLVNSTPDDEELLDAVTSLEAKDARVRVVTLEGNLGITENTNAGIDVARGEFLAFFDHDDILEPDCLFWYVKGINDYPNTDLLYCDEDKYENGEGYVRFPFFKPDWDPLFLETNNYVCHMLTVRADLVRSLPRPTSDLDGAQDHSMALAAGERARNVYHVRRILYHWRVHERSTAGNENDKPESKTAGILAVRRHVERISLKADVLYRDDMTHCFKVVPDIDTLSTLSLVVYGSSSEKRLEELAESLLATTAWEGAVETIPVCAPDERTLPPLLAESIGRTRGNYVILVSEDMRPQSETWLSELLGFASREGVGLVGPLVAYPDDTVKDAGLVCSFDGFLCPKHRDMPYESLGIRGLFRLTHQVSALRGGCLVASGDVLRESAPVMGACPGRYWDVGLCLELRRRGRAVVLCPDVKVFAPLPAAALTGRTDDVLLAYLEGKSWLLANWPEAFGDADPFYNEKMNQNGYYGLPLGL